MEHYEALVEQEAAALASSCKNWEAKLRAAAMPEEAQVGHGA